MQSLEETEYKSLKEHKSLIVKEYNQIEKQNQRQKEKIERKNQNFRIKLQLILRMKHEEFQSDHKKSA